MRMTHPGRRRMVALAVVLAMGTAVRSFAAVGHDASLIEAAKKGDAAAIAAALKQGVDVNAHEVDGTTALHWAAHRGDLATVDLLIRNGADAKAITRYGITPLSLACENGNAPIASRLLQAGANPNAASPAGETMLMRAARSGSADVVNILLDKGAAVDARESTRGQTALMWAAASGDVAVIQALLKHDADLKARATGPLKSLPTAKADVQGILLKANVFRLDKLTPLLFAARRGRVDAVRVLLEAGADVNDTAPDGASALALAIANAHYELAALLLERGADPNASAQGWSPLHQLVRSRNPYSNFMAGPVTTGKMDGLEVARRLIAHGASLEAKQTKVVDDGGPGNKPVIGGTALLLAAQSSDYELIEVLLKAGANPNVAGPDLTTPLLAAAGVTLTDSTESGSNYAAFQSAKLLVAHGADVKAANKKGDTVLHGAAKRGANALVEFAVANGARLDLKNKAGVTPLDMTEGIACKLGCVEGAGIGEIQPHTSALIRRLMTEQGLPVPPPRPLGDAQVTAGGRQ